MSNYLTKLGVSLRFFNSQPKTLTEKEVSAMEGMSQDSSSHTVTSESGNGGSNPKSIISKHALQQVESDQI